MKSLYFFLVLMFALMAGAGTRSYAYNFTGHYEIDSCGTGTTYYVVINAPSASLTMATFFGDGTSTAGTVSGTYGYNYHQYGLPGIYTVKHMLYLSGVAVDSLSFTDTVMCKAGYIAAFLDANSNCTWDVGEPFLSTPVDVEIDSAGVKIDTMHILGGGYRDLTAGKTYSMKMLNLPSGLSVSCPSGGVRTATVGFSGPTIYSFALQCSGSGSSPFDLAAHVSLRTGRHSEMVDIIVTNTQCSPQSATLTANLSPKYGTFISAYPTPASRTGNVLTWTLPNVSAFGAYHITVHYETGTTTSSWLTPGDTVHTSFYVTPTAGDANVANNTVVRIDTVTSSFDPNAKTVMPSGNIAPGTSLEYTVEFENDGNAPAENIYILDTLSANLDANSFRMVSSSAPSTNASIIQMGGYNILRFDLPGIHLLDSSHHGQCTGMIVFSVKAKPNLAPNTMISNRAGVYFDDNPVVMTSSAQNRIYPEAVGTISPELWSAYPNPVHDELYIKADGSFQSAQIINALGQVVLEKNISGKATMDVSMLTNGIYYLVLKGQHGTSAQAIEKQ